MCGLWLLPWTWTRDGSKLQCRMYLSLIILTLFILIPVGCCDL